MTGSSLLLGSPQWLPVAIALVAAGTAFTMWSYALARGPRWVVLTCGALKIAAFAGLALCLVEPLITGSRAVPGANVFVVLVDNSQSLQVRDGDGTRAETVRSYIEGTHSWKTRLAQDFDVRNFIFDTHLRGVDGVDGLAYDGTGSALHASLASLANRFQGRPLAGVLLVSDGNATDPPADVAGLPPIYPISLPNQGDLRDIAVSRVIVNQTNFEAAPVALQAEVNAAGYKGKSVLAVVKDEDGKELERQTATPTGDRETLNFRFQIKPEKAGVAFYRVEASVDSKEPEVTLANNNRLVEVDRGGGPYRVLYVSGRPNWEYKYLRRSLEEDAEVQLVGLIRVAKREAKFDFRAAGSGGTSPLFKGFENPDAETAERHDQPVLIRLGTKDAAELRGGFPATAAELFNYHAIILDDIEAGFFTPDQLGLLRTFVARRGGGLLMLGGPDTFSAGKYDRTPVGEVLPVYLDKPNFASEGDEFRLTLTREGWLQPWVRTRKTEEDETKRLGEMTAFQNINAISGTKPGATVLAEVKDAAGATRPALVAQPFGKGRVGAVLLGDLWRWGLKRPEAKTDDFNRAWRQTVRWLVGDVAGRVDVEAKPVAGSAIPTVRITVQAADAEYYPLDNAVVAIRISRPNGEELNLTAEPDSREAGRYGVTFVPRESGAFRAMATVTDSDGKVVGRREAGWAVQPEAEEFARLTPNRELLESLAKRTQGEMVDVSRLDAFVEGLPSRSAPVTETWIAPLWHRGWYFVVTLACLAAEWGLRRRFGMA